MKLEENNEWALLRKQWEGYGWKCIIDNDEEISFAIDGFERHYNKKTRSFIHVDANWVMNLLPTTDNKDQLGNSK